MTNSGHRPLGPSEPPGPRYEDEPEHTTQAIGDRQIRLNVSSLGSEPEGRNCDILGTLGCFLCSSGFKEFGKIREQWTNRSAMAAV